MSGALTEAAHPEENDAVVRSVQRTGLSSLSVTLPKAWTQAFSIHNGSRLRFQDLGAGRLELSPANRGVDESGHPTLFLDAEGCSPQLVSRLLVGAYITGHDHVLITSQREMSADLRAEVCGIAPHVLGMSVIEDEPTRLEVRIFLDATKHRLSSLLDRVVRMIRLELELCQRALQTADRSPLERVPQVEEEIDRFYLLMARQILLASNDFHVAREIGVPSHHYQLGYRVVVKMLEVTADLVATVAEDLARDKAQGKDAEELIRQLTELDTCLVQTMEAFREVSALHAHEALSGIEAFARNQGTLSGSLVGRSRDKEGAARLQKVLSSMGTARELLGIINEITINRAVEPETVALTSGQAVLTGRKSR